ncbi:MAG: FHA domain-containing protein [Streptosporangiales bacterium]|nr:FHA domain-containing protein [Streptosporangiales bacterium]
MSANPNEPTRPRSLAVIVDGNTMQFEPGQAVVVGRTQDSALFLDDPRVSRQHARIQYEEGGWILRDLGSRNGTFVGPTRVVRLSIAEPCAVRFGNPTTGPLAILQPVGDGSTVTGYRPPQPTTAQLQEREPDVVHPIGPRVRLGRDGDNDIVLGDLLVSGHHAEVRRSGQGFEIIDLNSRNGTYLNGQRVTQAPFTPGDLVSVGHHQFVLQEEQLRQYVDSGRVSLSADDLSVTVEGGTVILDRVGFTLDECSLLAVVGPSGAGKSTMLNALTGAKPAQAGRVVYEGRDLYDNYEDLRHRIGLVPQDDILHRQLTVKKALEYAAALRFPDDVKRRERDVRIAETCASLGLTEHFHKRIDKLSGGQRKRVSVALELLTQPSLLFLDEPTSGLDPGLDKQVMTELRRLADDGRTVIVVTHSVLSLDLCDRVLLLAPGGKTAYFGPPGEPLLEHFGVTDYASVFQMVTDDPEHWQHAYRRSPHYRQYGGAPQTHNAFERATSSVGPAAARRQQNVFRQFGILCRRMVSVLTADKPYAAFMFGLPLALALLAHAVPGDNGLAQPPGIPGRTIEAQQLLVVLIVGAAFMGTAVAIRELVGEVAIYRRERSVGLSPTAYLFSKLFVFGVVNVVQAIMLVLLGIAGRDFPKGPVLLPYGWWEVTAAIALLAIASTVLGLLISARVTSNEQTMPVLVLVIMGQLVFCGGLFKIVDRAGLEQLAWLMPGRWAYAAAAVTVDLRESMLVEYKDPLWEHTADAWLVAMGILLLQTVLLVMATRLMLRVHEPSHKQRTPGRPQRPANDAAGAPTGQQPAQPPPPGDVPAPGLPPAHTTVARPDGRPVPPPPPVRPPPPPRHGPPPG